MTEEEFNKDAKAKFSCNNDPRTGKSISFEFSKNDFVELKSDPNDQDTHLFKLGAKAYINKLEEAVKDDSRNKKVYFEEVIKLSVMY